MNHVCQDDWGCSDSLCACFVSISTQHPRLKGNEWKSSRSRTVLVHLLVILSTSFICLRHSCFYLISVYFISPLTSLFNTFVVQILYYKLMGVIMLLSHKTYITTSWLLSVHFCYLKCSLFNMLFVYLNILYYPAYVVCRFFKYNSIPFCFVDT